MAIKILGVDFRKDAVSVVLIRGSYKGVWMDAHAHVRLERPEDFGMGLASCIESVSGRADLSNATCVAALPADLFFYRNVALPFSDPRKIDQMLPYELEQGLPVPADDLIIDFISVSQAMPAKKFIPRLGHLLGFASKAAINRILAAAIEKSSLSPYLSILKQSGLDAERIVPGGYAQLLCLIHAANTSSSWLLVDADRNHTALFLVLSRSLTVIRAFPGSGQSPSADFLFPLIQQTLLGSCKEVRIDKIFLAGGLSDASAVAAALSDKCGVAVHPADLLDDAGIRLKSELPSDWTPETGDPALGAALARMNGFSGLNLRKGMFGLRTSWVSCRSGFFRTVVMAGLAVVATFAYIRIDTLVLEKQLEFLNRQVGQVLTGTFPDITNIVDPLHQMRTHVQDAQGQSPASDKKGHERLVDLLGRISSRIPENVRVELIRFVYEDGILQLTGHTDSFNSVEEIKRLLEGPNGGFSIVTIVSANLDNTGSRIQFHMNITT